MLPRLIVFDFHGVLSLSTGRGTYIDDFEQSFKIDLESIPNLRTTNIKNALRKYKTDSWYSAMRNSNISPYLMMPTLDEVVKFIHYMKSINSHVYFAIASMGEQDSYMFDMMKYCFESQNEASPFTMDLIVGQIANTKGSMGKHDKMLHIDIIINNIKQRDPYIELDPSYTVLIDDSIGNVEFMTEQGVCCVYIEDFFTIKAWNKGCYKID